MGVAAWQGGLEWAGSIDCCDPTSRGNHSQGAPCQQQKQTATPATTQHSRTPQCSLVATAPDRRQRALPAAHRLPHREGFHIERAQSKEARANAPGKVDSAGQALGVVLADLFVGACVGGCYVGACGLRRVWSLSGSVSNGLRAVALLTSPIARSARRRRGPPQRSDRVAAARGPRHRCRQRCHAGASSRHHHRCCCCCCCCCCCRYSSESGRHCRPPTKACGQGRSPGRHPGGPLPPQVRQSPRIPRRTAPAPRLQLKLAGEGALLALLEQAG